MNEPREDRNGELSDTGLREILQALPREEASPDFSAGVMARLTARRAGPPEGARVLAFKGTGRRLPAWSGWLMAAAALLFCGLGLREWQHRRELAESMQRIAELRGQYQELSRELGELRREANSRPVVFLGGNEQVDLVLDLGRLAEAQKLHKPLDPETRRKAKEELGRVYQQGGNAPLY